MTAPSDRDLKRLLAFAKHDDVELLPHVAVAMARELLVARPVVRLLRKLSAGESTTKSAVAKALDAYDKARKGKVT